MKDSLLFAINLHGSDELEAYPSFHPVNGIRMNQSWSCCFVARSVFCFPFGLLLVILVATASVSSSSATESSRRSIPTEWLSTRRDVSSSRPQQRQVLESTSIEWVGVSSVEECVVELSKYVSEVPVAAEEEDAEASSRCSHHQLTYTGFQDFLAAQEWANATADDEMTANNMTAEDEMAADEMQQSSVLLGIMDSLFLCLVHDTREGALPVCWEGEAVEYSDGTTTSHNSTTLSDLCSLLVWATDRTNDFLGNNIEDRNFVNFYFGPHDIRHRHLQGTMVGLGPNIPPTTLDPSLENLPRDVLCRYHLDQRFFTFSIFSNKSSLYDDPWQYEWKEPLEYVMAMATVEEGVSYRFFHRREWVQKAIVAVVVQILDDMETEIVQKENAILYGVEGFESTFSPLLFRVVGGRAINFTEQVDPCLPDWTCWKGVPSIQLFPTDQVLPENSTEADGDYRQARQEQAEDFEQRLRNFLLEEPQVNGSIAISSEFEQIVQSHVPDNVLVTRIPEAFLADPPTTAPTATPSASEAVSCNTIMSLFFVSTFILSIVDY